MCLYGCVTILKASSVFLYIFTQHVELNISPTPLPLSPITSLLISLVFIPPPYSPHFLPLSSYTPLISYPSPLISLTSYPSPYISCLLLLIYIVSYRFPLISLISSLSPCLLPLSIISLSPYLSRSSSPSHTASDILLNKKERKRLTINRNFAGDYLGFQDNPSLRALVSEFQHVTSTHYSTYSVAYSI